VQRHYGLGALPWRRRVEPRGTSACDPATVAGRGSPPLRAVLRSSAPFTIDSYSGPWTIAGQNAAYFVGWCPACGHGTVSLTVTLDGGRHFRRYRVPKLTGFRATGIRVVGHDVTITAKSRLPTGRRERTVTVEIR
jgi:hypothetical protein